MRTKDQRETYSTDGNIKTPVRQGKWFSHFRRQMKLLIFYVCCALLLAPIGILLNIYLGSSHVSYLVVFLTAASLFVIAPVFLILSHLFLETPLVFLNKMPWTGTPREIYLRVICQGVGLFLAAYVTAQLIELFTNFTHVFSGALLSAVGMIYAFLIIWTLYQAFRDREMDLLRFKSLQYEAKLQHLTEQMQPHFLFNALNGLAELVEQSPKLASQGIMALASLYQSIHEFSQRTWTTAEEEFLIAERYLEVQSIRMGDGLRYSIQRDSIINHLKIPPFTILLLVENAIKHGRGSVRDPLIVEVRGHQESTSIVLRVSNSTRNTSPALVATHRKGSGLDNLKQRFALMYNDLVEFDLTFQTDEVVACIRIPNEVLQLS